MTRRIKGGIKRRETDPASNQFPKCSPPSGTHKEIHRVGSRREVGGRRQRQPGGEKGESKGGESSQAVKQSRSQVKMSTEDWVLKGTKLITNTKKQRLRILNRGQILKNTILNKQTKKHKVTETILYIYMKFALKIVSVFFFKVIVGYKNEN